MENETQEFNIAEFEEGFGSLDYQTGETEDTTDNTAEAAEAAETEENPSGENGDEAAENGAEGEQKPDKPSEGPKSERMLTFKVNKEERSLNLDDPASLDELRVLAQKGADYDRVKGQVEELRKYKSDNAELVDVVAAIAKANGTGVADVVRMFRKNMAKAGGLSDEAADERIAREDAERKLSAMEAERAAETAQANDQAERVKRDVQAFTERYPGVQLTQELLGKLSVYLDGGKRTLVDAYSSLQLAEQNEKIAQLTKELEATKQTAKNAKAPGSMRDAGAKPKTEFDDFWAVFNK